MNGGWRSLTRADAEGLRALARACDEALGTDEEPLIDRGVALLAQDEDAPHTAARADAHGLAAAGWIDRLRGGEPRALLRVFTRPDVRPFEDELIEMLHGRAVRLLRDEPADRPRWVRADRVLRGHVPALPRETLDTYGRLGLTFLYVEHEMRRPLDPLPAPAAFPNGVRIEGWTRERDAAIREAYNAAFADRGFAGYGIAEWAEGPFSGQESFRPELSFLALEGGTISGFVLCTVEDDEPHTGWIDTVGVRPAARARGIADALLLAAMRSMHAGGLQEAALRVNDDNPRARRVYDRLGFATQRKHVVYRKAV